MEISDTISTSEIKAKLRELKKHLPNKQKKVYEFGSEIAGLLTAKVSPLEFITNSYVALCFIQQMKNPAKPELNSPAFYDAIENIIPDIAQAVCPPDFARAVRELYESSEAEHLKRELCLR